MPSIFPSVSVVDDIILKPNGLSSTRLDGKNLVLKHVNEVGEGISRIDTSSSLTGTTDAKTRGSLVDTFNMTSAEQNFCFLLSAKAGGCGLNLIGASRLIMLDLDWNPSTDVQAMARVYRQGQTRPTFIYRLLTSGSIDEAIYQRQQNKGNLASKTVDGEHGLASNYTNEELNELIALKDCVCDTKEKLEKGWPEYEGISSLKSSKYQDGVLLQVAQSCEHELGFVHFVEEETLPPAPSAVLETTTGKGSSDSSDCSSSEEEEFDY